VSERHRVHIIFRKSEGARFLSHLDLLGTLEFSVRRARLPVELSEGFNPRPRMSLVLPLVLGHTGEREILEITLREPVLPAALQERLQATVPPGIVILEVREVPVEGRSAASRVRSATYRVDLPSAVDDLEDRVRDLLARDSIEAQEVREGRVRIRDLRSLILSADATDAHTLRLHLVAGGEGSVRPEQVLDAMEIPREGAAISRESIEIE
jgi:radical SAM-linked protein